MRQFCEQSLKAQLETMPPGSRIAFAASCAQRLRQVYQSFVSQSAVNDRADVFDRGLACVWQNAIDSQGAELIDLTLSEVMALIPDEDAPGWTPLTAYAANALSALAYSLRCVQSGDAQEAAWAARHVYEALDHFVASRDDGLVDGLRADADTLDDPLIQRELERQARDIDELQACAALSRDVLDGLRGRSATEQAITAADLG
ncbi:MAG: hypothetical protein CHACPFDD_03228 [Phycisphaerae bacterium]|nr:hypothetical protein [Phycisphaerae bacterium]